MASRRSGPRPISGLSSSSGSTPTQIRSYADYGPTAEAAIRQDLDEYSDTESTMTMTDDQNLLSKSAPIPSTVNMDSSFHRRSFLSRGPRPIALVLGDGPRAKAKYTSLSQREWSDMHEEVEELLRDNKLIPSKNLGQKAELSSFIKTRVKSVGDATAAIAGRIARTKTADYGESRRVEDEGPPQDISDSSERDPLLSNATGLSQKQKDDMANGEMSKHWNEAIASGKIQTTWRREAKTIAKYSWPLICAFLLQYSLTVASIFTVGHLGKVYLGATSLASMTSNISGWAIYQGLATSLDTLCAQAYGSGKKKLVGLQFQRMVLFLWVCTIPIGIFWLSSGYLLQLIIPDPELGRLAGVYLRIILFGAPGFAAFESGKRFMQAQGLFTPILHILLICAPLNAFMNWLFVWKFKWGFVGAPIAVAVTDNLLAILLLLYVRFIAGSQCWGGFTRKAWHNWGPMIRLALPGFVMVEAEFLAFEILTLLTAYFGSTYLAAQSVLSTVATLNFQIPFSLSVAASTRIANLIGATLIGPAKTSTKVTIVAAVGVGLFNVTLLLALRDVLPPLFTNDRGVIELIKKLLPVITAFQLFDALAANCNGILRGLGRQKVGGYVNLFCYYVVSPTSNST
jgi:MATE family multidrug resistance protein